MIVNVIGAGLSGATVCARLKELDSNIRVRLFEIRDHIGGNCHDRCIDGNWVQTYGPHIFHTNSDKVKNFIEQYGEFNPYSHEVKIQYDGKLYTFPVNKTTVEEFNLTELDTIDIINPVSAKDELLSRIGTTFYEAFFKEYTIKQWGKDPSELPADITRRIPVKLDSTDPRYFTDEYQMMPVDGFTKLIEKMIGDSEVIFGNYKKHDYMDCDYLVVTSRIDEFFDYQFGELGYRYTEFQVELTEVDQGVSVINYPELNVPYTRSTQFNRLYGVDSIGYVCKEYPKSVSNTQPTYPVESNIAKQYREYASGFSNIKFLGRLGQHRYYNMDQAILEAINLAEEIYETYNHPTNM